MRRWLRRILVGLAVLAVLLLLAPRLADTGFVRARVARAIAEETGGEVVVGALEAGWWSGIEVRDVRITASEGEFRGAELLALERASLAPGLLGLIGGPDTIDVEVAGLVVTVDERARGRTSLDAFLRRVLPAAREAAPGVPTAPPPVVEPPPKARPGPKVRIRVRDSRVVVRHLPYAPPEERINPFERDVPIRPIDAGLQTYAIEASELEMDVRGQAISLRAKLDAAVGERRSRVRADLETDGRGFVGELEVVDFDLSLLQPLVERPLAGFVRLKARGEVRDGAASGDARIEIRSLAAGALREDWVRGRVEVSGGEGDFLVRTLELGSASGRFGVTGTLTLPRAEPWRPSGRLTGSARFAPLYAAVTGRLPPADASLRFEFDTDLSEDGGKVRGQVAFDDLTRDDAPDELTLRFFLRGERATRKLSIDTFAVRSGFLFADLEGEIVRPPHFAAELRGRASAELPYLQAIARRFGVPFEFDVEPGRGALELRRLSIDEHGAVSIETGARLEGIRVRGGAPFDVEAGLDGTFTEGLSRLELRDAFVHDLHARGAVQGLGARDALPSGRVTVTGELPLDDRWARALGVAPGTALDGAVAVNLDLTGDGRAIDATGRLEVRDVAWRAPGVAIEERDASLEGTARFDGRRLRASGRLAAAVGDLDLASLLFDADSRRLEADATLELREPETLRALWLPEAAEWRGVQTAKVVVTHDAAATEVRVQADSPALTFRWSGHGIAEERARIDATIMREETAWSLRDARVRVPGRELEATLARLDFARDAPFTVDATTRLEHLPRYAPALRGPLHATLRRGADGRFSLDAESAALREHEREIGRVRVRVADAELGRVVRLPRIDLRAGEAATLTANVVIDRSLVVHATSSGEDFGALAALLPSVSGAGSYELTADLAVPLRTGDGHRFALSARGRVGELRVGAQEARGVVFGLDAEFEPTEDALEDLLLKGFVAAEEAKSAAVAVRGLRIENDGRGTLRRDGGGPGHRLRRVQWTAREVVLQDRTFESVQVTGSGILHHHDLERRDALDVEGDVSFAKGQAVILAWHDASARVRYDDRVAVLENLRATAKGGQVRGAARVDLRGKSVPWSVELDVMDAKLDRGFTDPLSYVLPILRLSGQNEGATGNVTSKLKLAAEGTDWDTIRRTLEGGGQLRIADAEITGSLLMPLLSLRIGQLLLNKPYRIPDSTMSWTAKDGVVTTEPLKLNGLPFPISLGGTVTLDGELDYIVHPGLLLVPVRVSGTWGKLSVLPAPAEALPKWPWKK